MQSEQNPFPGWVLKSSKKGGVNDSGPVGGVYENTQNKTQAMIKRDTKKGKPRVEKVMSEFVGGGGLKAIYEQTIKEQTKKRVAEVSLMQVGKGKEITLADSKIDDVSGEKTYLKSNYIPKYQNDFWKFAYEWQERKKIEEQIKNAKESNTINNTVITAKNDPLAYEYYYQLVNYIQGLLEKEKKEKIKFYKMDERPVDLVPISFINKLILSGNEEDLKILKKDLVKSVVDKMKRPSAVKLAPGSQEKVRDPLSEVLEKQPGFKRQFAEMVAPRLLIADYGVHNANIGVALDDQGMPMLTSLDYGACFERGLTKKVNPFVVPKNLKFYKHHFLEYNDEIIKSPEMALQFYKTGTCNMEPVIKEMAERINIVANIYSLDKLKKFAKRLGVDKDQLSRVNDALELKQLMKYHISVMLPERAKAMKQDGIDLMLKCFIKEMKGKKAKPTEENFKAFFMRIDGFDNDESLYKRFKEDLIARKDMSQDAKFFNNSFTNKLIKELQRNEKKSSAPTVSIHGSSKKS